MDLTAAEIRVLGCLVEKQRLTPDAYPLSLNSLRLACNQSTSRDPVVEYDEATIREALHRLGRRRYARLTSGAGSRAAKYRHLLDEALGLPPAQLAVLSVLMLRSAQTPGELRQRTERMHRFGSQAELQEAVDGLVERELALRLDRRPGQKEERYAHRLGEDAPAAAGVEAPAAPAAGVDAPAAPAAADERIARLERDVAALKGEVAALRDALGG